MNRDTKIIKTKAGKDAVLHSWITARERRELKEITLRHAKFGMETDAGKEGLVQKPTMQSYDAVAATRELEDAKVKLVVVSYDGSPDNVLERLLDSHESEWDSIMEAVNTVTENPTEPK